jgi:hypothetical protein
MKNPKRKIFLIIVCCLSICLLSTDAWSQGGVGVAVRGGLTTPVGDFNKPFNLGYGGRASLYVHFSPVATIGLGAGYDRVAYDESDIPEGQDVSGGELGILNVCPELTFMVGTEDMPTFSFVLGAGLYRLMQTDVTYRDIADSLITWDFDAVNKFGINTTGRVVFPMSPNLKLGVEASYHLIFTKEDDAALNEADYYTSFMEFMAVIVITSGT